MPTDIALTDLARKRGMLDEILGRVLHQREEFTITRYGRAVARLVPLEDVKLATDPMTNRSLAPVPVGAIPTRKKR